ARDDRKIGSCGNDERPMYLLFRLLVLRGWGALIDPGADFRHIRVAQGRLLVRHRRNVLMLPENRLHEITLLRAAWLDGRTDVATLEEEGHGVRAHPALLL